MTQILSPISVAEKEKRFVAASSVGAAVLLTSMKLIVGLATGSLGILAEAAHSGLDLVAALVTYFAVRVSDKPPDEEHPYGHGKVENFSALIETILLFITCAWIVYEAVQRIFFHTVEINAGFWAFLIMIVSIVVDVNRSRMLFRAARKHHSQALEADALHFSTDIWSSSVVIGGLALVWAGQHFFPGAAKALNKADAVAALLVAFIVVYVSFRLGKRTIDVLLDSAPDGLSEKFVEAAAEIKGVEKVGQVRLRRSGPRVFVDMNVEVDRNLSFEQTHAIAEAVEARVQSISPGADVVVHTDPRESERETVARRIQAVAERNQMFVHNISVHEDDRGLYVDLHLEVDDHLSLVQAHEMASRVEKDLLEDMPEIRHVNTHIESRGTGIGSGRDVTVERADLVEKIRLATDEIAGRPCCHDIMLRRLGEKYSVALHCHFEENLPIVRAHEIATKIEDTLKAHVPDLVRVLVHVEPAPDKE